MFFMNMPMRMFHFYVSFFQNSDEGMDDEPPDEIPVQRKKPASKKPAKERVNPLGQYYNSLSYCLQNAISKSDLVTPPVVSPTVEDNSEPPESAPGPLSEANCDDVDFGASLDSDSVGEFDAGQSNKRKTRFQDHSDSEGDTSDEVSAHSKKEKHTCPDLVSLVAPI